MGKVIEYISNNKEKLKNLIKLIFTPQIIH